MKKLNYGNLNQENCKSILLTLWDCEELYSKTFVNVEQTSLEQIKRKAKNLKEDLREFIPKMKLSHSYELIAMMMELNSWNVLSGWLKRLEEEGAESEETESFHFNS